MSLSENVLATVFSSTVTPSVRNGALCEHAPTQVTVV